MSILQQAVQTLAAAEAALKRLIGEAAERGEYSSVETLARWATSLGAMCSEEQQAAPQNKAAVSSNTQQRAARAAVIKRKAPSKTSGHSKRRAYPVFVKSGDNLLKIAWSKSSKSEYQHKSPCSVIKVLANSFAQHAKNDAVVSMHKILPLRMDDGSEIPDYQVYVSLAWLRQMGVVKQNGRQGYTVSKVDDLLQKIDAAWSNLPKATVN